MNNIPLVSIVTVTFNSEKTLCKTIESVFSQTYKNIEYIIIDGGSSDSTVDIIKSYESKLYYWESKKDNGIYDAMNKGINKANGELIGIINSDDWYNANAVENIVNNYLMDPSYDVYYGLLKFINSDGSFIKIVGTSFLNLKFDSIEHPSSFIKKEAYNKYGLYSTSCRIVSDYEFFLRLFLNNARFLFIEVIISNFRIGGESTKNNKFLYEKYKVQKKYNIISMFQYVKLCVILFFRNVLLK